MSTISISSSMSKKKTAVEDKIVKKDDKDVNNLTTSDIFRLIDLYFYKKNYMYRHLYHSYDNLLEEKIKNFLEYNEHVFNEKVTGEKVYRRKFKFSNVRIISPRLENDVEPMFPSDARHKNYTYAVKIVADVGQIQEVHDISSGAVEYTKSGEDEKEYPICQQFPLMLRSKFCSLTLFKDNDKNECRYDPGGYFIVNGSEKVIICQDRMVENKPLVFIKKDSGTMSYIVQVNSKSYDDFGMSQVMNIKLRKDNVMTIRVPILNEVNVFAVFRALGVESDKDIIDMCAYNENDIDMIDIIRNTLDKCKNEKGVTIQTKEEALDFLINKMRVVKKYTETDKDIKSHQKKMHLEELFKRSLLPHMKCSLIEKAYYLGYMINHLLNVHLGRAKVDDRDSYVNKRIDLPGDLLFELFKQYFKKVLGECGKFFAQRNDNDIKPLNCVNQIKASIIDQGLKSALSTGSWMRKKGVSQMLQRFTFLQYIAFMRRVDASGGDASSAKLTGPRHLHPSSIGGLCPVQTPEHAKIGLTKHLSLIGSITVMSKEQYLLLREFLLSRTINLMDAGIQKFNTLTKVFLNGEWLGMCEDINRLKDELNGMKLKGIMDRECVMIIPVYKEGELRVYCDSGRLNRPMLKVVNNELLLKKEYIDQISLNKSDKMTKITDWDEFLNKYPNTVEYIDMESQPYLMLADKIKKVENMRQKMVDSVAKVKDVKDNKTDNRYNDMFFVEYTHCEFHPSLLLGEINTNIPFSNRNAGPRNIFCYAQSRQAMGLYATNYRDRLDISYILYYPQKPLVTTRTAKYVGTEILPSGENAMVAIACYTGLTN
uniref:DNA-directed RNA polymerase n=1 Tax=viral metagenome TaxID=1070528 RepID=A0A6C0EDK7_9ZZZZ